MDSCPRAQLATSVKQPRQQSFANNYHQMLFMFPGLCLHKKCIDVVQFCSKFASCHFADAEKAKFRHRKVPD